MPISNTIVRSITINLLVVSQRGKWEEWLRFFLRGITAQAQDGVFRMTRLQSIRTCCEELMLVDRNPQRMTAVIDFMFSRPILTLRQLESALDIPYMAAKRYIDKLVEAGVLYVSTTYATVVHKCGCGCGNEVITPLTPDDWQLTFDYPFPSIGNWSLPCRSHYWIKRNEVRWAESWSDEVIRKTRNKQMGERLNSKSKWRIWDIFGKKQNRN